MFLQGYACLCDSYFKSPVHVLIAGLCDSYFKSSVLHLIAILCGSYFKPRVSDYQVPTLVRHNNTSLPPLGSSRDSICYSSLFIKRDLPPTRELVGMLVQSFGASGYSRWKPSMYSDAWV